MKDNVQSRRDRWWQYSEYRRGLVEAIAPLDRLIAITRVSRTAMPVMIPASQVMSEAIVVFAANDLSLLATLSGSIHYWWAIKWASGLKADLRYTGSAVFETLPLPRPTMELWDLGYRLDGFRRELMLARQAGLTKTYNMMHDPACNDADILELREIHKAIDEAVCRTYGWDDLIPQLDHKHHDLGRETRFTVGSAIQREFVDRLLELNHERYAAELAAGLHDKKAKKGARGKAAEQGDLF